MLIRSSMKNDLGAEFQQQTAYSFSITYVGNAKDKLGTILMVRMGQAEEVKSRFALIQANELSGAVIQDLTTQFGPNGTCGSCNKNASTGNLFPDSFKVYLYGVPSQ